MQVISIKRIYDAPSEEDGCRVLVDRVWPRGSPRKLLPSITGRRTSPLRQRCESGSITIRSGGTSFNGGTVPSSTVDPTRFRTSWTGVAMAILRFFLRQETFRATRQSFLRMS